MLSERLHYHPVEPANLDAFHGLVQDKHVRRYMLDGNVFPREWSAERIRESQALFERRGVGTWLAYDRCTNELVGFCGFPAPQPKRAADPLALRGYPGRGTNALRIPPPGKGR
jgi:RimJ/RimL family protein N-acetyltransferase